jgi:hypothetical protein
MNNEIQPCKKFDGKHIHIIYEKMSKTKTIDDCKRMIAEKYCLGKTLVTGHKAAYWEEAMELYASQFQTNVCEPEGVACEFTTKGTTDLFDNKGNKITPSVLPGTQITEIDVKMFLNTIDDISSEKNPFSGDGLCYVSKEAQKATEDYVKNYLNKLLAHSAPVKAEAQLRQELIQWCDENIRTWKAARMVQFEDGMNNPDISSVEEEKERQCNIIISTYELFKTKLSK